MQAQGHPPLHPPVQGREVDPAINILPRPVPRPIPRLMSIWQDSLHTALVRHHEIEFHSLVSSCCAASLLSRGVHAPLPMAKLSLVNCVSVVVLMC